MIFVINVNGQNGRQVKATLKGGLLDNMGFGQNRRDSHFHVGSSHASLRYLARETKMAREPMRSRLPKRTGAMPDRQLILPDLGLGPTVSMRLSLWLARRGDSVAAEQSVVEIVAGSVVVDLPSPIDGVLVERLISEDQPVSAGDVLGVIRSLESEGGE
jgi:hypothetical protein